jgi:ABC-type sugar transport system ATPase subunit
VEYLEFRNVGKAFPGVVALDGVSFTARAGKVVALLGENGAGKSTLLKILSADIKADTGKVVLSGKELSFSSTAQAINAGISVIYQERQLIPAMSVMENVFIGELPVKNGLVDFNRLFLDTKAIIDKFGLPIDPEATVMSLPVAYQQMVEIMKAYRRDCLVIAFDEPTAPLTDTEIDILFNIIRQLKEAGKIIIYVSHRIREIFQITDEIAVLKDGRLVKTLTTPETDQQELISAMVGRDIGDTYASLDRNGEPGSVVLEVDNLCTDAVDNVSFTLRAGEIVGFAGLVGAGRTEVARAIFGADRILSGEIRLGGGSVRFKTPRDAIKAGIALCPEDRKEQGLVLWASIRDNICMPVLHKLKKLIFLDGAAQDRLTQAAVEKYSIRTPSLWKRALELSGGNQQKVILGRWTSDEVATRVLILDEPTKGIDIGTKAEIYQLVCDFAKRGVGVIFISSELTEVINVADRIIVMHNGHITGEVARQDATEEKVLSLAMLS